MYGQGISPLQLSEVDIMENFKGTEWENMTEEEVFLSNQKYVKATIARKFPNHRSFCGTHMIEIDDLIQLGNLGLLSAIRTFDPKGKSSFRSYAINCISWSITTNSKKESLRSVNTQTFELANIVSVESNTNDEEETTILDTIEAQENTSEIAEDNVLGQSIIEFLKADEEVDEEFLYIIVAKANGKSVQSIADHLGTHRNTIGRKLSTKKAMRIKERLAEFLKNGD